MMHIYLCTGHTFDIWEERTGLEVFINNFSYVECGIVISKGVLIKWSCNVVFVICKSLSINDQLYSSVKRNVFKLSRSKSERMSDIQFEITSHGRGSFFVKNGDERLAEMVVSIVGPNLTVYHTQVSEKLRGQGIAAKLLSTMVDYVREHNLKVIALCPYVHAEFKAHPEKYTDIWNQDWHNPK